MELEALLDIDTGGLSLKGNRWRLNATWSPNMSGNDGDIDSIHTPYSKPLLLTRSGKGLELKIGELNISYVGWEVEKSFLKKGLISPFSFFIIHPNPVPASVSFIVDQIL